MPAIIHIVPFCLCCSRHSQIVRDALMTENRLAAGTVLVGIVEAARCTVVGFSVYSRSSGRNTTNAPFLEPFSLPAKVTKGLPEPENSERRWTSEMVGVLPASSNGSNNLRTTLKSHGPWSRMVTVQNQEAIRFNFSSPQKWWGK